MNKFVKSSPTYDGDKFFTIVDGIKVSIFFKLNLFFLFFHRRRCRQGNICTCRFVIVDICVYFFICIHNADIHIYISHRKTRTRAHTHSHNSLSLTHTHTHHQTDCHDAAGKYTHTHTHTHTPPPPPHRSPRRS